VTDPDKATSETSAIPAMPSCGMRWETHGRALKLSGSTTSLSATAANTTSFPRVRRVADGRLLRCSASMTNYSAGPLLNYSMS
jgi:hypothetical protein